MDKEECFTSKYLWHNFLIIAYRSCSEHTTPYPIYKKNKPRLLQSMYIVTHTK